MSVWAIVLGGGSGSRFTEGSGGTAGADGTATPKQFLDLGGRSLIAHSVAAAGAACDGVVAVVPDRDHPGVGAIGADVVVSGGAARADSVRAGLAAVPADAAVIVIADAAHPLASPELFTSVVDAVRSGAEGAFPALPLVEVVATLGPDGSRVGSVPRTGNVLVQTPQAFRADLVRQAHSAAADAVEDSAMVAELAVQGRPARVVAVPGDVRNVHVTTPVELEVARALLAVAPWAGRASASSAAGTAGSAEGTGAL